MMLNWRALIREALKRRKAEKLTQKQHATLAGVSIPTIIAFDRGERTLSLSKAFDILRVVGLLEEKTDEGGQEGFVEEAMIRWRQLLSDLPADSPARFPNGFYRIDYSLHGDLTDIAPNQFQSILAKAVTRHTRWPMFWTPTRPNIAPYEHDGHIECWLAPTENRNDRAFQDPAHYDFWCAAPTGRMFLIRGYQEDGQETFGSGTIFDTTLPIWRLGEALLHAAQLSRLMKRDEHSVIIIKLRVLYTGLSGRVLRAWANPLTGFLFEGSAARNDEAVLATEIEATEIDRDLAAIVFPLVASLYGRFGVSGLSNDRVREEILKLQRNGMR